jgi:hypothetical protein
MAHNPSSSSSNVGASHHDINPFHAVALVHVVASTIQLLNICSHVLEILDLHDSNYSSRSSFFELTFQKFGIVNHIMARLECMLSCSTLSGLRSTTASSP